MNEQEGTPTLSSNPFSPIGVASVHDGWQPALTVPTSAIKQVAGHLTGYLASSSDDRPAGQVIAVVGGPGSGKSHLAAWLVRQAAMADVIPMIYVNRPSADVRSMCLRLVTDLGLDAVVACVKSYYADVVAGNLHSSELAGPVVKWLRAGKIDPQQVVEQLGLEESALQRETQRRLTLATGSRELGIALYLLLRRDFHESVWDWLTGADPAEVLRERGIPGPIEDAAAAMDVFAALAELHCARQGRTIFVLEEIDKILALSAGARPMFDKLLGRISSAGAFLVLCGWPDVPVPPSDQWIGHKVTMPAFDSTDTCSLISETMGTTVLEPFTQAAVHYLVEVTGGCPRRIVRLCHDLYRAATDQLCPVSREMVLQMARSLNGTPKVADVSVAVEAMLTRLGFDCRREHALGDDPAARADFWVSPGGGGCAIQVVESVQHSGDVDELVRWATAIRSASPGSRMLVVVAGTMVPDLARDIEVLLDAVPLAYSAEEFAFAEMFSASLTRLLDSDKREPAGDMAGQLERIVLRQELMIRSLDRRLTDLSSRLDRLADQ